MLLKNYIVCLYFSHLFVIKLFHCMTVFMTSKNFISSSYIRLYFLHQLLRWTNCTESGFRITFLEWCERSCVTSCWAVLDHELNWSMFIIMMQNKGELGAMGQKCSLVRKSLLHHSSHWFGLHKMNASSLLHWNKIQLFYGVRNNSFLPCGGSVSSCYSAGYWFPTVIGTGGGS